MTEETATPNDETPVQPVLLAAPVAPEVEQVVLRHPHTGDTKIVDSASLELIQLMGRGYGQVKEPK